MSQESFENFRSLVLEDHSLQQTLREKSDYSDFVELVVSVGNERGYDFTANDVNSAYNASRRAWIQRWFER